MFRFLLEDSFGRVINVGHCYTIKGVLINLISDKLVLHDHITSRDWHELDFTLQHIKCDLLIIIIMVLLLLFWCVDDKKASCCHFVGYS